MRSTPGRSGISIHALLAESDNCRKAVRRDDCISIHALLAESDSGHSLLGGGPPNFNPRSPCGERLLIPKLLKTLSQNFNPRSPCGERPVRISPFFPPVQFQSTLSLRRATAAVEASLCRLLISIHALLAESDHSSDKEEDKNEISIHALLAESDFGSCGNEQDKLDFNPRSPCGERQQIPPNWPYRFCLKCQFKDGEKSKKAKGSASAQASSPAYEKNKVRIPWGDFECFRFAPIK